MSVRRSAVALVTVLLLAGCSTDDPDPVADPTPALSSSTPVAEPSASPTSEPSDEPESAEEFIRTWFDLHNQLSSTGESETFREVSVGCDACLAIAKSYEDIYSAGGSVDGGVITVISVKKTGASSDTWVAQLRATPTYYQASAQSPTKTLEGGRASYRFVLDTSVPIRIAELFQESV